MVGKIAKIYEKQMDIKIIKSFDGWLDGEK